MTYMIDARLEQGMPSLTLIDAVTGEERLHWRGDSGRDWSGLFKRLVLLSCIDKINLVQRAKLPVFGDECIDCFTCVEQEVLTEIKSSSASNNVVSLFKTLGKR